MNPNTHDKLNGVLAQEVEPYIRLQLPERFDKIESVDVTSWSMNDLEIESLIQQSQSGPDPLLIDPKECCIKCMVRLHIWEDEAVASIPYFKLIEVTCPISKSLIHNHLHTTASEIIREGILRACIMTIKSSFKNWE